MSQSLYELTTHIHVHCGGRILIDRTPDLCTTGGDPAYVCADCEEVQVAMTAGVMCVCGKEAYGRRCMHRGFLDEFPQLKNWSMGQEEGREILTVDRAVWHDTIGQIERPEVPVKRQGKNPPAATYTPKELADLDVTERSRYPKHWSVEDIREYHRCFLIINAQRKGQEARLRHFRDWPSGHIPSTEPILWSLQPHICKRCQCRMLRSEKNQGMSPGGNPIWMCSGCGYRNWSMGGQECYCGWTMHDDRGRGGIFICKSYDEIMSNSLWSKAVESLGMSPGKPYNNRKIGVVPYYLVRALERQETGQ